MDQNLQRILERILFEYGAPEIKGQYADLEAAPRTRLLEAMLQAMRMELGDIRHFFIARPANHPLIAEAISHIGGFPSFFELDPVARLVSRWGRNLPRDFILDEHSKTISQRRGVQGISITTHMEDHNTVGSCADFSGLDKAFIKDLKLFEKSKGKFIEGVLVTPPLALKGITTFLEDERGDIVQLGLYNMLKGSVPSYEIAEKKFPKGAKLRIAEPYFKIFSDCNKGIRVDCPADISITSQTEFNYEQIIEQGKSFLDNGEPLAALDAYTAGLKEFPDVILLLNNRSQAELKLEQYELALLDAAAVLLIDRDNEKGRLRYRTAAKNLGFAANNATGVFSLWKRVLTYGRDPIGDPLNGKYSREDGNKVYKDSNYYQAKLIYTAVLRNFNPVCKLLAGIAFASLKSEIFQTAISAASACLQIAKDEENRKQAQFAMTNAFYMLGEIEFAQLAAMGKASLGIFHDRTRDTLTVVTSAMRNKSYENVKVPSDFLRSDAIEHSYISGKGRGLRAKRNIQKFEVLIVDHPIACIDKYMNFGFSLHAQSKEACGPSSFGLQNDLILLCKYNGLLAKKLLLLETKRKGVKGGDLPLVQDLEWMAYRQLNHDVLPFLAQTPDEVGVDGSQLTPEFIRDVVITNSFEWGSIVEATARFSGSALHLRVSLFNHDNIPNCAHLRVGDAMVIVAGRDIRKGEELIIFYGSEDKLSTWGL